MTGSKNQKKQGGKNKSITQIARLNNALVFADGVIDGIGRKLP